jgi:phosphate starvation-inducible PhoH-like protein
MASKKKIKEPTIQKKPTTPFLNFKKVTLTEKQKQATKVILDNKISVITGPPGTAKSFTACNAAIKFLKEGTYSKIILIKPLNIIGSQSVGFLKGTLEDKLLIYREVFVDTFSMMIEERDVNHLFDEKIFEFKPVNFLRGTTFKNSFIIVDEFQQFCLHELFAILTRLSSTSRLCFIGDQGQADINKRYLAVNIFKSILSESGDNIGMFEFDMKDTMRDPILIRIMEVFEQYKEKGLLPPNTNGA